MQVRGKIIAEKLKSIFPRVVHELQGLFSSIIVYDKDEPKYVICVANTLTPYIYGRFTCIDKASTLDCNQLIYMPNGLFVYARSTDEFINKLLIKLKRFRLV